MAHASPHARSKAALLRFLALLLAVGLVTAACADSDDGDDDTSTDTSEGGDVEAGQDTTPEGTEDTTETGEEGAAEGEPIHGGRLVYGIEGDSANP